MNKFRVGDRVVHAVCKSYGFGTIVAIDGLFGTEKGKYVVDWDYIDSSKVLINQSLFPYNEIRSVDEEIYQDFCQKIKDRMP